MSLYPLYLAFCVVWIAVQLAFSDNFENTKKLLYKILLSAPMELCLVQSVFAGSFKFLHNGGTWFMSCLFVCYLFYPYVARTICSQSEKRNIMLALIMYFFSSYAFFPAYTYKFAGIYSNPLLRLLEFSIGIIIADSFMQRHEKRIKKNAWIFVAAASLVLFLALSFGARFVNQWRIETYNFIAIPCFSVILYFCARLETTFGFKHFKKAIILFAENTYAFYLAQSFSLLPAKYLMNHTDFFTTHGNLKKLLLSLVVTCLITVFFHYGIEKPCRILSKKLMKNNKGE